MTEHKQLEKANMLLVSKEMTDKDRSMKTQLLTKKFQEKKFGKGTVFLKTSDLN